MRMCDQDVGHRHLLLDGEATGGGATINEDVGIDLIAAGSISWGHAPVASDDAHFHVESPPKPYFSFAGAKIPSSILWTYG